MRVCALTPWTFVAGLVPALLCSRHVIWCAASDAQIGNEKIVAYFSTALSFFS
jgi:hypothetical protein